MRTARLIFLLLLSVEISLTIARPKKSSKSNNIPKYIESASFENSNRKTTNPENNPNLRIINGHLAELGQFPHHVYVSAFKAPSFRNNCGGSLISTRYILTAKRCTRYEFDNATISFGVDRTDPILKITATRFISHPEANIGLIDLEQDVKLTENIDTIILAKRSQTVDKFPLTFATIVGYGWVKNEYPDQVPDLLSYLEVLIAPMNTCKKRGTVFDWTICTVGLEQYSDSPCLEDDGGALMIRENEVNVLIGVFDLWKFPCTDGEMPSIYVAPQHFWPWINQQTGIPIRE